MTAPGRSASTVRIVSLVPSVTETLVALGAAPVACTRFCEQPCIEHVGGTKNPDVERIVELAPDLVVVDTEENRREDAEALQAAGQSLLTLSVRALADADAAVARLARAAGVEPPAADVATAPAIAPERTGPRVRAFVPIWRRPWMTIGPATYGADVLRRIGVDLVGAAGAAPYPTVELADVVATRPDVVLVPSEPYRFDDAHLDELRVVAPVLRVDGQDLFWWGIRTAAAIGRLDDVISGWRGRATR